MQMPRGSCQLSRQRTGGDHEDAPTSHGWAPYSRIWDSHNLRLPETMNMAQNQSLRRMWSTYGTMQSWVACQKRQRQPTEFHLEFCNEGSAQNNYGHAPTRRWKEFDDMCIRLDTIPECDGQMKGQTERFAITLSCSACIGMQICNQWIHWSANLLAPSCNIFIKWLIKL